MRLHFLALFAVTFLASSFTFAQAPKMNLDSLEKVVNNIEGIEKLEVVIKLAEGYMGISLEKAEYYAREGYILSMSSGQAMPRIQAYDILGKVNYRKGNYSAAESCFRNGLAQAELIKNPKAISILCNSMGILMKKMGDYEMALTFYQRALQIYIDKKALRPQVIVMGNIGGLREKLEQYDKAIEILEEALVLAEEKNFQRNISVLVTNLGSAYEGKKEYTKALHYYEQALAIKRKYPDLLSTISTLSSIFSIYSKMQKEALAEKYYQEAWQIAVEKNSKPWQQSLMAKYGDHLKRKGRNKEALSYYEQSLSLAETQGNKIATQELREMLADLEANLGHYDKAYAYRQAYDEMQKEMFQEDLDRKVNDLEQRYELQQKLSEAERELQDAVTISTTRQKRLIWMLVAVSLMITLLLVLYNRYQIKQRSNRALSAQNEEIQKQNDLLEVKNDEIQAQNHLLAEQSEEIRNQNQQLQQSNADLEQFAYAASHDLREPLRTIKSYMQLLERRYSANLDQDGQEFIRFAMDGSTRMDILLQDLLDYSRIGRSGLQPTKLDMNDLLAKVMRNLDRQISDTGAKVLVDSLPEIYGYESEIYLLFQNLISNGIKFHHAERPPEVKVTVQQEGGYYIFGIRDNGIGIPIEFEETIFTIFQRLHSRKLYDGTGIGLAICKKVVNTHKGEIWLESKEDIGSTFFVKLPAR